MNTPAPRPEKNTAADPVILILWILLAVSLALNAGLSLAGYLVLSVVFGLATLGLGTALLVRHLRRRAS